MIENSNVEWDYFYDEFNQNKWNYDGVAELQRIYVKNGLPIFKHIGDTDSDPDVVPYPIAARGISAYLADESIDSFRYSFVKGAPRYGVGSSYFFTNYFDRRKSILRQENNESTVFEDERMLDSELIQAHLNEEQLLFEQSDLFYSYEVQVDNIFTRDTIKKASLKYHEWVKKTFLNEHFKTVEDIQKLPNGSLSNVDSLIFVPKFNEDIIDDLYEKLRSYFVPQERFKNFLIGNHIEVKINFTGNQNMLAGIFILSKEYSYVTLGTHRQTFDFIKQTFLIKGDTIATNQILSYLSEPGSVDKFGNLKDETKPGKANRKTFINISI